MPFTVAIVGAGIMGITNAVNLLAQGFAVTSFSKDEPLATNSDAAVATWFSPDDSKPVLQQLCLESLPILHHYSEIPGSGVEKIPIIYFFKSEEDFENSIFANDLVKKQLSLTTAIPDEVVENHAFPFRVAGRVPLANAAIYRPFLLKHFFQLGGKLEKQSIHTLNDLTSNFDIIINCAGWEAKQLANDPSVYPIRGQVEIANIEENGQSHYSLNIKDLDAYVVYRPQSHDVVLGTTYKVNESSIDSRQTEREEILNKLTPFFAEVDSLKMVSKVGIRCGRSDARVEQTLIEDSQGNKKLLVHCYGHSGSGFSASWGSAKKVLEYCQAYDREFNPSYRCRY